MIKDHSLYLVITEECGKGRSALEIAKRAIAGGVDMIQMREKDKEENALIELGRELAGLCRENNVIFIVNDNPVAAKAANAHGVHLGQEDLHRYPVSVARNIMGEDKIIGVSTHSFEQFAAANEEDIDEAFKIWDTISESQELNLPPYIFHLYQEVILPAWNEKNSVEGLVGSSGLTRQDIIQKHYKTYGRFIADWQLRQQIIPMLETAGLITQEADQNDKRKMLIYPTTPLTISAEQNNSESDGGVEPEDVGVPIT